MPVIELANMVGELVSVERDAEPLRLALRRDGRPVRPVDNRRLSTWGTQKGTTLAEEW